MRCTLKFEFKILKNLKPNIDARKRVVNNFPEYSGQPTSHWVRIPCKPSKSLNPNGQSNNSPANRKLQTPNGIPYNISKSNFPQKSTKKSNFDVPKIVTNEHNSPKKHQNNQIIHKIQILHFMDSHEKQERKTIYSRCNIAPVVKMLNTPILE